MGLDAHLVLTLYDEIVVETKGKLAEKVQGILKDSLSNAFTEIVPNMPFELDFSIADSWKN
jgi:DNA polymerase I-like protein with 3'-5' exonuclease and polymerase domains